MGIIWTIVIGFVAGVIAKLSNAREQRAFWLHLDNNPWNCGCRRCFLAGSSLRLVPSW